LGRSPGTRDAGSTPQPGKGYGLTPPISNFAQFVQHEIAIYYILLYRNRYLFVCCQVKTLDKNGRETYIEIVVIKPDHL
jgi:hypothetical protein